MRLRARVAAITALAVTIVQLAAIAHDAESRHRWCEEHGVSEELVVAHDHGDRGHLDSSVTEGRTRAVSDHEACEVCAANLQGHEAANLAPGARVTGALPDATAPPAAEPRFAAALFRLAPKTSPPVA